MFRRGLAYQVLWVVHVFNVFYWLSSLVGGACVQPATCLSSLVGGACILLALDYQVL